MTAILLFTIIIFCNSIDSEILYGWDDGEYTTNEDIQNIDVKKFSKRIELQPEYANAIYNRGTMPDTTSTRLKRHARTGRRQLNLDQKKLR